MSAAFAVFAIIYAFITNKAAEKGKHLIKEEEDTKSAIIEAFLSEYTKEEIDYKAGGDDLRLSEEELALERLNYIQDRLSTEHDINPSFATEIAEEIYNRIFE